MKPISILLVEDNPPDARYVREVLPSAEYAVVHVDRLSEALCAFSETEFDIVLLDLSLPDSIGLATLNSMMKLASAIPIVVLTGLDDQEVANRAVNLGAQDFVLKREMSETVLTRAIRYAIERKQTEKKAQRLVILEQREEFMATLTHDLKNPLIGANRILELIAGNGVGPVSEEQSKLLIQLRDSNKMLLSMIQNLIEVYRFERDVRAVTLVNTNCISIISSCLRDIEFIAKNRHIEVETEVPDVLRDIVADGNALRRVIQNLLDNALKFTPPGGKINLAVEDYVDSISIEIKDNGPGIPREEQEKLFQRFSQGRAGRKYTPGTGLGLYLCKQIVDAHRGQILCTSEEGVGTTFTVKLPISAA